jgi:hypothetical protein
MVRYGLSGTYMVGQLFFFDLGLLFLFLGWDSSLGGKGASDDGSPCFSFLISRFPPGERRRATEQTPMKQ